MGSPLPVHPDSVSPHINDDDIVFDLSGDKLACDTRLSNNRPHKARNRGFTEI